MKLYQSSLRIILLVGLFTSNEVLSQLHNSPIEAYMYVQSLRDSAGVYTSSASPDSIKTGIGILRKALSYLNTPKAIELATQFPSLKNKPIDVHYDLALAYMQISEKDSALENLERIPYYALGQSRIIEFLKDEKTFEPLLEEPRFKSLLANFNHYASIFNFSSILTSYSANLSVNEKLFCLTIFWNEVRNRFVHFNLIPNLDWNKTFLKYISKVQETNTTREFFKVMEEFCALLGDSHTNVFPPDELQDSVYSRPQFRADLIEDKVIVTSILDQSLKEKKVKIGLEIIAIDSIPINKYVEDKIIPYTSSSTHQDLNKRVYNYSLFNGDVSKSIRITFKDESDNVFEQEIPRAGRKDEIKKAPFSFKLLDNNIAYCALNSFNSEETSNLFENSLNQILSSNALILDVRNNGGGGVKPWRKVLSYLTDKEFKSIRARIRASNSDLSWIELQSSIFQPNGKVYFSKPVVLLIGTGTFSAAEDFCVVFDYMKRGKMIGEPTAGSSGEPYFFNLPGGLSARVCSKHDSYPDGKEFIGIGVQPNIIITPTIDDITSNRDVVLEAALNYLNSIRNKN